jgi:L-asparaginase
MKIKVFITGGTFDKEYDEVAEVLFFKESHVREMLERGRSRVDTDLELLMMKDSLDLTDAERQVILENCQSVQEERIVITHGTGTMVETAKVLSEIKDKTIVLTGAMVPYKFSSSDGMFNLGSALSFVQVLPHGVYIAMNGKYFTWDNVQKNKQFGEFEELH